MSRVVYEPRRDVPGTDLAEQPSAPSEVPRRAIHPRRDPGSIEERLVRVLDTPHLARVVPLLPAETLHQLVRYRGVEDCGELLAAAMPAQLTAVVDLDLWRSAEAGFDEILDVVRFGEWVEGLVEGGHAQAATIVSRIDSRLVEAGLSGHINVFDHASLSSLWSAEDDAPDDGATPFSGLAMEIDRYVVRARRADSWDAIVALLLALEADHPDSFHSVMRGCRHLSNSRPEVDGLDDLMTDAVQLLHDVGHSRHDRRSRQGFLAPAEARAFLQMARQPLHGPHPQPQANPIVAAYFRPREQTGPPTEAQPLDRSLEAPPELEVREAVQAVAALLAEAARPAERPRPLLTAQDSPGTRVHALMEAARVYDEPAFLARSREVAFLANALTAGCSVLARPFTPQEASAAALATCNLGIELWPSCWRKEDPDKDLLTAFHIGWRALHESSLDLAQQLVDVLRHVRTLDTTTHEGLVILRRELENCCRAGSPWGARDALDVLAILDTVAWTGLLGVLDECPVVADALTAIVERRKGPVSATAFEFVSSTHQIAAIRAFGARLASTFLELR